MIKKARLRKFLGLTPLERRLLIGGWFVVVAARVGLFLLPFRAMLAFQQAIARRVVAKDTKSMVAGLDEKVAWAVDAACRRMPGRVTCLRRAMSAAILLNLCGAQADLCIGVVRDKEKGVAAHAWVEREGKVVVGDLKDLEDYSTFPPL